MSKKKKTIIIVALLLVVFIGSISYALWSVTLEQTGSNVVKTGCFTVNMQEESPAIELAEAYPIVDSDAYSEDYDPFTFTIQNTCNIDSSYSVNLEVEEGTTLSHSAVKVGFANETPQILTAYEKDEVEDKYQLTTGTLRGASSEGAGDGEKITYDLRLWLDENASKDEMSKDFYAKIVVENITTTASKVIATGDISASEADAVTYTLYEDGLLKLSGNGATKSEENIVDLVTDGYFETACLEAGLDCSELKATLESGDTSISDINEMYSGYDSLIEMLLASGESTQEDLDAMGVTTDAQLVNAMFETNLDEENTTACLEIIKNIDFKITDLKIEEGITLIGSRLFSNLSNRKNVDLSDVDLRLPSTIDTVETYAFSMAGINSITLNEGLATIEAYAFYNTTLNNYPTSLNLSAQSFNGATFTDVVDLTVYESIPVNAFFNATFEQGVVFSENLKEIGQAAFQNANLSGELVIPNSVEVIGNQAFAGTQISVLKLPENDVYHGFEGVPGGSAGICNGCMNLKEVEIPLNVYNLVSVGQDIIWGDNGPEGAKYIMPIKASEYGDSYRIYSVASNTGFVDLGAVTSFEFNDTVTLEWQPE